MPELRRDPIIGRWVIIASERSKRPLDFEREKEIPDPKHCPFCPGNESKTPPEILAYRSNGTKPNESGWWVRVVPNKYPALQVEGTLNRTGEGMYDKMNGIGAHEVIIEGPDHTKSLADFEINHLEEVLWAYRDRIVDLKKDTRFEYILIFKNHGFAAGASLFHTHSQLIATPIVPKRVNEEVAGSRKYYDYKERCVYCDMVKQEMAAKIRLINENDSFIAIAPFAARFPFETWIMPKRHASSFEDIQKKDISQLAIIMKDILKRMNKILINPPYNFILHNSPLNLSNLPYYHWHIEIIPKLTRVAGFEWGTGFHINPTLPEDATKYLREVEI